VKKSWVFVAYLIFAAYILLDGMTYVFNPYFGRVSAINCKLGTQGRSLCTVTIYGFRETFRRSFEAEDFYTAARIDHSHGTSDTWTCGITLVTTAGKINFVHPYQPCGKIEPVIGRIHRLFGSGESSPVGSVLFIGFNSSLYRRVFLLLAGLYAALSWHKWPWIGRLTRFDLSTRLHNPAARLGLAWWQINLFIRSCFFLSLFFISALWSNWYPTEQADFFSYCFQNLEKYCSACAAFPLGSLLCLYPFLAFTTLQAIVQWKFLQSRKMHVSSWWAGAPALASLPLVFLLAGAGTSAALECTDCTSLRVIFSGLLLPLGSTFSPPAWIGLLVYLLFMGFIQALVWQSKSVFTWGWSLVPLVNTGLWLLSGVLVLGTYFSNWSPSIFYYNRLVSLLVVGGFLLCAFLLQDSLSALYLAWMKRRA
jgi:hypothetical protein